MISRAVRFQCDLGIFVGYMIDRRIYVDRFYNQNRSSYAVEVLTHDPPCPGRAFVAPRYQQQAHHHLRRPLLTVAEEVLKLERLTSPSRQSG